MTTIAYWLLLLVVTHLPLPVNAVTQAASQRYDKPIHVGAFCVLSILAALTSDLGAAAKTAPPAWSRNARHLALFAILLAYAAIDELTQPWTRRVCDPLDFVADAIGVAIGLWLYRQFGERALRYLAGSGA